MHAKPSFGPNGKTRMPLWDVAPLRAVASDFLPVYLICCKTNPHKSQQRCVHDDCNSAYNDALPMAVAERATRRDATECFSRPQCSRLESGISASSMSACTSAINKAYIFHLYFVLWEIYYLLIYQKMKFMCPVTDIIKTSRRKAHCQCNEHNTTLDLFGLRAQIWKQTRGNRVTQTQSILMRRQFSRKWWLQV